MNKTNEYERSDIPMQEKETDRCQQCMCNDCATGMVVTRRSFHFGITSKIRTVSTSLRECESLLKLDPTNTELLKQKQEYLAMAGYSVDEMYNGKQPALCAW